MADRSPQRFRSSLIRHIIASVKHSRWLALLLLTVVALGLFFRYRATTRTSLTYDEGARLFLSVYYKQKGRFYEPDIHPPVLAYALAQLSPWLADFRDADAFTRNAREFSSIFSYRLDHFSGLPSDQALVRARFALQLCWLVLLIASWFLSGRLGLPPAGRVVLIAFLSLEPTLLGLTTLLTNDFVVCSLLVAATAVGAREERWAWWLATAIFALGWGTKLTAVFWAVPLALAYYCRCLPRRCLFQWAGGALGGFLLTVTLGGFDGGGPLQDPNFRLTYLDGVRQLRTPLVYFLQAWLCKSSLAVLALSAFALRARRGRLVGGVLLASVLAASFILPGLGVRLVMPLMLTALVAACAQVRDFRWAAACVLLLAAESALHFDRWLAYQNPLAGREPHLMDSNCDWGQGVKELAAWRRSNPQGELAIALFGGAQPEIYGIDDYRRLASAPELPSHHPALTEGLFEGYVAVSRNFLHGYFVDDPSLRQLVTRKPLTCFQDALCLYDVRKAGR